MATSEPKAGTGIIEAASSSAAVSLRASLTSASANISAQDAIETFSTAKGEFNKEHLLHAVAAVAGVNLEPQTVDILFHVFDDDRGGTLNHQEFTAVMKLRQAHGASRKRQIDVTQFAKCCNQCWRDNIMFNT